MFDGIAGGSREACTVGWERLKAADLGGAISGIPTADDTQHGSGRGPCFDAFLTCRSS